VQFQNGRRLLDRLIYSLSELTSMIVRRRLSLLFVAACSLAWSALPQSSQGGVLYQDPAGGWRYTYQGNFNPGIEGNPPGFGDNNDFMALDGTWQHNQSDRWDGHVPGDPISDPTDPPGTPETVEGGPNGWSPGGAGSFTEGATNYIRVQDPGNPELHGWLQGSGRQDTNRRVYYGHDLGQEGALPSQLVLDNGFTLSFRARVPNSGPMDDIYAADEVGTPIVRPWFDPVEAPNGRGGIMTNSRGSINIMQNDPANFNLDSLVGFSLVMSTDIDQFVAAGGSGALATGTGSGGLIMNNLNGSAPSAAIDSESAGTLNILEIPDEDLNEWREFWITIDDGGPGTHIVRVYMDGSTTPTVFNVTAANNGNAAYASFSSAYLEFGFSDTAGWGSFDIDFISYKLGVTAPLAAPAEDADFDNDSDVDGNDFLIWQRGLGTASGATNASGDADGNGSVNGQDLAIWKTKFGTSGAVGAAGAVPEPSAWALAALLWPAVMRRRR
jgi:hypothetical protein